MIIVNYEVYVLEQPRGWMLHARFPRQERETAINEAKELEQTLNIRVKVVRETYYTDDNKFEEAEVYISGMKNARQAPAPAPSAQRRPSPAPSLASAPRTSATQAAPRRKTSAPPSGDEFGGAARPRKKKAAKAHHLVGRLLAITAVALAAALLSIKLTPNVIMFLWDVGFRISLSPNAYGQVLFAVFVLVFLMTAVPLAIRFLPRQTEIPAFKKPHLHWAAAKPPVDRKLKKSLDKLASQALAEDPEATQEPAAEPPLPEDEVVLPEILPGPEEDLPEIRPDPEDETPPPPVEEPPPPTVEEPPPPEEKPKQKEKEKAKEEAPASASADSQLPAVNRFLNGAVNAVKTAVKALDSYNKFALHLYMAGAIEALCDFRKIGEAGKIKLTMSALETLGTKADLARKFYEKLPEYLLEPRYLGVVQAGRDAMGDFLLGGEAEAHGVIKDVMKEWNKPQEKKASVMTVMFTDMVGSTDLTQAVGDRAAQEIVRKHNSIVRGALAQYSGREIKHTGDGIMASFASAANAVEATISIQRQVTAHNQRAPDLELHLRIGLNAGEPIEEEDDLFGTTVQLAARVCAATDSDQILCTGVVKDLSLGKGGAFRSKGEKMLKGFRDPVALYEIVWND